MANVVPHISKDELRRLIRQEKSAVCRDRLRLVLLVMEGRTVPASAALLGYGLPWGWKWLRRFNAQGVEGLAERRRPGQPHRLSPEQEQEVGEFAEARAQDPRSSRRLQGVEAQRFIEERFGVSMSLSGVYVLLHRLGFGLIKPRPRHEKNDPAKMREWKEEQAPLLSKKRAKSTRTSASRSGSRTSRASGRRGR